MRASGMCVIIFTYILAYSLAFPYVHVSIFLPPTYFLFRAIVCVWQVELFLLNEGGGVASRYK